MRISSQLLTNTAHTHRGYSIDHAVGDLILPHVFYHVELSCSLLGDNLVCNLLQFRVEFLKEIFEEQRQKLGKRQSGRRRQRGKCPSKEPTNYQYKVIISF